MSKITFAEAAAKFGHEALLDKGGNPLTGVGLMSRVASLEKQPPQPVHGQTAAHVAGSRENPLPATASAANGAAATPNRFASSKTPYAVRTDVPLPKSVSRGGRTGGSIYPYADLPVGGSFFVPVSTDNPEPWKTITSLTSRACRGLFPKSFETRRLAAEWMPGEPAGCGVWRVEDATEALPEPTKRPRKAKAEAEEQAPEPGKDAAGNTMPHSDTDTVWEGAAEGDMAATEE